MPSLLVQACSRCCTGRMQAEQYGTRAQPAKVRAGCKRKATEATCDFQCACTDMKLDLVGKFKKQLEKSRSPADLKYQWEVRTLWVLRQIEVQSLRSVSLLLAFPSLYAQQLDDEQMLNMHNI